MAVTQEHKIYFASSRLHLPLVWRKWNLQLLSAI